MDFKVLVDPKQVKIGEPDKFDDIGWFEIDNLPDKLHSQIRAHLKIYHDKLINNPYNTKNFDSVISEAPILNTGGISLIAEIVT